MTHLTRADLRAAAGREWILAWRRTTEPSTWKCRGCGCTETEPCVTLSETCITKYPMPDDYEACSWVAPGLCSECA